MSAPPKSFAEIFNGDSWEGLQLFVDGSLQANDGTTFNIHRVVLSQRSGYFRGLFTFHLNQETIVIPNIESNVLESILVFIYTGTISLDEKNVCDIMVASDYLLLDDLMKRCRSFIIQNITSTNCLSYLSIAWQFERLDIKQDCYRYALVHFKDILEALNCGLKELPFEILKKLLESISLNVISEKTVWEAIILWTEADSTTRLPHVPELLTCLKLDEEIDVNLTAEILSHPIISMNPHLFSFKLGNQLNFITLKNSILSQFASSDPLYQNASYFYGHRMPSCLHIIARHTVSPAQYGSELFLSYDNEFDFGRKIQKDGFFVDMMLRIGQHIFLFEKRIIVDIFDIAEETWTEREIPPLPTYIGWTITLREKLYHIHRGIYSRNMISSYGYQRNRWENITTARNIAIKGVVALKDRIFVAGISDEDHEVMMCQAYDPEKNAWISLSAPNIYRECFLLEVYHDQVFLIPADKWDNNPKVIEVYDWNQNTWMSLPDLPFEYLYTGAVIVDDKVFVYENIGKKRRRYQKVGAPPVYWDESDQLWRIIDESSPWYHIERYSFLALDDCQLVKDLTAKNRRSGIKWERICPV